MDRIAKAIVASLVSFGAMFETASAVSSVGGETVTTGEWVKIGVATLIAGVAVWAVPNKPEPPTA